MVLVQTKNSLGNQRMLGTLVNRLHKQTNVRVQRELVHRIDLRHVH